MKQPEIGRKIFELRTAKGWTQEELVEKCNISIRTIQRIEAGEVVPRIYTIKTILAALDYDLSKISDEKDNIFNSFARLMKKLMLIDIDINKPSDYLIKQLNIAWIIGIIYFILFFFHGPLEYIRFEQDRMFFSNKEPSAYFRLIQDSMIFSKGLYVTVKILGLIAFVYFQRGFIVIGGIFKNYLLKIVSFILICITILLTVYDIASIYYNSLERQFVLGGTALAFGVIGIIYGVSLNRLHKSIGIISRYAGIFEIIAGCFFLTIVLSFINFAVYVPARIIEIIIIYKVMEIIKKKATLHSNT